jgi:hypothetical protein
MAVGTNRRIFFTPKPQNRQLGIFSADFIHAGLGPFARQCNFKGNTIKNP